MPGGAVFNDRAGKFAPLMLELLVILAYVAALIWAAGRAFAYPKGVYWRSALGVIGTALAGALLWALVSPSNEAGLGAFLIWCALVALALVMGLAASLAATLRHVLDAAGAQRARS